MTKYTRAIGAAGVGLLLAASAIAQGDVVTSTAAEATASQIVVRDSETGKLRAATAAEARALAGARASGEGIVVSRAPLDTVPRYHASGAHGVRLSDEFMSYSVTVRQADGTMLEYCFQSREEAEAGHKAVSVLKTPALATE